jgi:hypothetical protein
MKKRTKRDIILFFGIIVIIGALALTSGQLTRGKLIEKYDTMRTELEAKELAKSNMLLQWNYMRETKGSPRKGGTFSEGLMARDGDFVNVVGFMVPLEQWIDVTEFMLLPLPLECYFCNMPPPKDVMLVTVPEGQIIPRLIEEPVLMNGKFTVNQGPDQKFFYTLSDATMGAMEGVKQTPNKFNPEHMAPPSEHPGGGADDGLIDPTQSERVSDAPKID